MRVGGNFVNLYLIRDFTLARDTTGIWERRHDPNRHHEPYSVRRAEVFSRNRSMQ